jgi:uncharacterized membrane protein
LTILHFSNRYFGKNAMKNNNKFLNILAFGTLCVGLLGVTASIQAIDTIQTSPVTQGMPQTAMPSSSQGMEKCFGVAKAGQNDCDAGMDPATCDKSVIDADPNYWIYVPQGLCNKLVGGMTTPGSSSNIINTVPVTPMPAPMPAPSTGSTPSTGTTSDPGMAPSTLPGSTSGVVQ